MPQKIPLILLPGLLCDAALWRAQVEGLGAVAEPLVIDLTKDDTLGAMARRALAAAPPSFALAGLSMGGYVAQEIMRQAPERVAKLALLDTSARADTPEQAARRRGLIELSEKGEFKGVTPRLLPLLIHAARHEDKPLTEIVMAWPSASARKRSCTSKGRSWAGPTVAKICAALRVRRSSCADARTR
jgi:pimeloyl-ACP methyl ester carboxylesterase